MIKTAFQNGVRDASKRFGVREASVMELLQGIAGTVGVPIAARAAARAFLPNAFSKYQRMINGAETALSGGMQNLGRRAAGALRGPGSPAEALAHGLAHASPAPVLIRDPGAFIEHMSRVTR
jgi:hypothetical protein